MKTQQQTCMIKTGNIVGYFIFILFLLSHPSLLHAQTKDKPLLFLANQILAPVAYNKDGRPAGLAVEIVRELEKKMDYPITIICMDWAEAQKLVSSGEADALIQINPTEERKKSYDFSDALLQSQFSIFTRNDRRGITGASSLSGLRVGVEKGGFPHKVLQEDALVHLVLITDFLEAFKLLRNSELDAVVVDYMVGGYVLAENQINGIRISGEPIAYLNSSIAVKKGNKRLLNDINVALGKIRSDGTYSKVLSKWEPKDVIFMTQEQITSRTYVIVTYMLSAMFIIAVAWAFTLYCQLLKRRLAESRLKQKSDELEIFFSTSLDLFCIADCEGNLLRINERLKDAFGYSIEDLKNIRLNDLIHPDDFKRTSEYVSKVQNSENIFDFTNRCLCKDGSCRWIEWRAASSGKLIYAAARDVTDRKRAEEVLHQLNRELRAIRSCNATLMRAVDEQTLLNDICRIICDEAGYHMAWVGYAESDAYKTVRPVAWAGAEEGYLATAAITWADTERGRGPSGTAIRSGETTYVQDFTTDPNIAPWRKNALQRSYRSSIALPLKDDSDRTFGVLNIYSTKPHAFTPDEIRLQEALAHDLEFGITALRTRAERGRAEEKIEQLAAIVESSGDAIIGKTLNGKITSWNKGAEKIYGYAESEMIGKPVSTLVQRDKADELALLLERIKLGEHIEGFETIRRKKDGEIIHMSLSVSPIRDAEGRIVGASTIGGDITGRKLAEEEIRKLNQELEQRVSDRTAQLLAVNSELEAFAYSVSHDLRAPLRHIDGFLELLQKRAAADFDEKSRRYLSNIFDSTKRMGTLIDDLLSFSRMGRYEMSKMQVDLGALVEEVIRGTGPEASGREVRWRVADLPVVMGDRAMLRIVLDNLIANALKFTRPRSHAEIEIGRIPGEGSETVIFIHDNGVGFDMKYADKLFGVFQRLHRVDEFEGTGIGLANVRRIINRHGGRIWAEASPNRGATFYFSLPQPAGR